MYQAVAPCAASRGNRLLALTPSPLSLLLSPRVLPGCGNAAARWSVSGSLSRTETLKTLLPAGRGEGGGSLFFLAASDEPPLPPCQCGGEGE